MLCLWEAVKGMGHSPPSLMLLSFTLSNVISGMLSLFFNLQIPSSVACSLDGDIEMEDPSISGLFIL